MALDGCVVAPTTVQAQLIALFLCGQEVPITKIDLKKNAQKSDVTTTASYYNGSIWAEYAPGVSGGTLSWQSFWRISSSVQPIDVIPGKIYAARAYIRRPGGTGAGDPGSFYAMNIFIDDSTMSMDPKAGTINWSVSATATGPITDPT